MRIYAVINEKKRTEFEKKYQVSYGYTTATLFDDMLSAIAKLRDIAFDTQDYIVEECESGFTTTVYRL